MIGDPALAEYADRLEAAGFTIYEPASARGTTRFFRYSRLVNGQECFGYVQRDWTGSGYSHSMPIRPSVQHGSSMFVHKVKGELTVEAARLVARPSNWNDLVGTHANYNDPRWSDMYVKRGA